METAVSVVALVAIMGVVSTVAGRLLTRKKGARWLWDHSSIIGWGLVVVGGALILAGFLIDGPGPAMATKAVLGSMLILAGLWMIW